MRSILQKLGIEKSGRQLLLGGAGSFVLNVINQGLLLLIAVFLARLLGVDGFGAYAIALSIMTLCALPFGGGFAIFVIRHVSRYLALSQISFLRGFVRFSALWVLIGGGVMAGALYFFAPFVASDYHYITLYHIAAIFVLVSPLLLYLGAIIRGSGHVIWGRIPEFLIQPLTLVSVLAGIYFLDIGDITAHEAFLLCLLSYGAAIMVALGLNVVFAWPKWRHNSHVGIKDGARPVYDFASWTKSALPLLLSVGIIVVNSNIDIIMVGALSGEAPAGQYRVASRMAGFVLFFLLAANNVLGPVIAARHSKGERRALQQILTQSARLIFIGALFPAVVFWLWPQAILTLLFGQGFGVAALALVILSAANLFSVAMGQVGHVMALSGYEKYTMMAAIIAFIINIAFNMVLIPLFGMNGAAIATAISIIVWNTVLAAWTVQKTGYHCSIFGGLKKRF